jgi:hypothetical protein
MSEIVVTVALELTALSLGSESGWSPTTAADTGKAPALEATAVTVRLPFAPFRTIGNIQLAAGPETAQLPPLAEAVTLCAVDGSCTVTLTPVASNGP